MQEAEHSLNHLVNLVEDLVASNTDIRFRLDALAIDYAAIHPSPPRQEDTVSLCQPNNTYEADLHVSRPYRKLRPRSSIWSIRTSQQGSMALSAFSDLTLGNISHISVLNLPVWCTDLSNAEHYHFGQCSLPTYATDHDEQQPCVGKEQGKESAVRMDQERDAAVPGQPAVLAESYLDTSLANPGIIAAIVAIDAFYSYAAPFASSIQHKWPYLRAWLTCTMVALECIVTLRLTSCSVNARPYVMPCAASTPLTWTLIERVERKIKFKIEDFMMFVTSLAILRVFAHYPIFPPLGVPMLAVYALHGFLATSGLLQSTIRHRHDQNRTGV